MDNGKLQQFTYSRSLITNRGTVERELAALQRIIMHHQVEKRKSFVFARRYVYYSVDAQEQPLCQPITMTIAMAKSVNESFFA